ncbi:MAG: hypothetical protein EON93_24950 [Burkholderiales bacterium]|nr:MAG: hypothetical protein EON93_24950 [Burkholderiales bacterium]
MNTHAPERGDDKANPAALRAPALSPLWDEARAFVGFIFEMFCADRLRTTGAAPPRAPTHPPAHHACTRPAAPAT